MQHRGSSGALVDSSAPSLGSIRAPAPHWWIPAPHSSAASCFQRRTSASWRTVFMQHSFSSAPFLRNIADPARHLWIPAPHSTQHWGSRLRRIDGFQLHSAVYARGSTAGHWAYATVWGKDAYGRSFFCCAILGECIRATKSTLNVCSLYVFLTNRCCLSLNHSNSGRTHNNRRQTRVSIIFHA